MSLDDRYVDLKGREFSLTQLDADERRLLKSVKQRADRGPPWHEFANVWMKLVGEFYHDRGLSCSKVRNTDLYRIAQDLGSRLAVAQGIARIPDYRDEIEQLIRVCFKTRREFCEATGLSEDMLSYVLLAANILRSIGSTRHWPESGISSGSYLKTVSNGPAEDDERRHRKHRSLG